MERRNMKKTQSSNVKCQNCESQLPFDKLPLILYSLFKSREIGRVLAR